MDEKLEIFTLGGLTIRRNGSPVTDFGSRKTEALLVYLASTGHPQPREVLAELFWEEHSQTESQNNLRVLLHNLREHVKPFVAITRQTVGLNPAASCWLDTAELDAGIQAAKQHLTGHSSLSGDAAARLEQALALYKGDFLAGFLVRDNRSFNDWASTERERLRQQVIEVLHYLVESSLKNNAHAVGITQATRSLQIDPFREETYYQLMLLLSMTGQRTAALAQYEICRRVLNDEFGVEPGEAIMGLYEKLRSGKGDSIAISARSSPPPYNLPPQATPFIGRDAELIQIAQCLAEPTCRLLTLIGPGGIGKTRLALQAAAAQVERFTDGVNFVSLASINSPDLLASAITDSLLISVNRKTTPEADLIDYLADKNLLLVLDNFDYLLDGAALVEQLLDHAPGLKILTTTRERLNLQQEWLIRVHGMHFPEQDIVGEPETYSAIRLFNESARRGKAGFSLSDHLGAVIKICRQLEGIPLAIELAAAWIHVLPAAQIAQELGRGLDFLVTSLRNIPERHRSLRASFEYSWRLLTDTEQHILMQLSVFGGGFEAEAAEYIAAAPLPALMSLIAKSLLQNTSEDRFSLHEVIRHYACDKLTESSGLEQARDRHLDFYIGLAEEASPQLRGREQRHWLDRMEVEHDNLRGALAWALESGKARPALRLSTALWPFWRARGYITEGRRWLDRALIGDSGKPSALRASAFQAAGILAWNQSRFTLAYTYLQEALAITQGLKDPAGIAAALNGLGLVASSEGNYAQACAFFQDSLALRRAIGSKLGLASTLKNLGLATANQGYYEQAQALYKESLGMERELNDKQGIASTLNNMGASAIEQANFPRARHDLEESLAIRRELGDKPGIAGSLYNLGLLELNKEVYDQAQRFFTENLAIRQELEDSAGIADGLNRLAECTLYSGDPESAYSLASDSLAKFKEFGYSRGIATAKNTLGNVLLEQSRVTEAYTNEMESLITFHALEDKKNTARCLRDLAGVLLALRNWEQTARLLALAEMLFESLGVQELPGERHRHERYVATVGSTLDEATFAAVWADGRSMSIEQAINSTGQTNGDIAN